VTPRPDPGKPPSAVRVWLAGMGPLLLVAAMTWWFLSSGVAWLRLGGVPIEKLAIERVVFRPQEIVLKVRNEGPGTLSVGQLLVNDAIWDFSITPGREIGRMKGATLSIPYDWLPGEPYVFTIVSGTGLKHSRTVELATMTPSASPRSFLVFGVLGAYVGVIPVFLGLLWLPFLRAMPRTWMDFWLSLTIGLLLFLGVDTLKESIDILGRVAAYWNGVMLVALGVVGAFFSLNGVGRVLTARSGTTGTGASARPSGMALATLIAIGIGLHNLGEGLAIGAAYTLGEVALGSFLIVGFTLHNTTEGLAILSPLVGGKASLRDLGILGLLGGGPTIIGAWAGAFTYSDPLSLVFLGIGAGAIFQVVRVLARGRAEGGESVIESLSRPQNAAGLLAGFIIMYATSLLVAG
jgi:zinc transporter, ZIP family